MLRQERETVLPSLIELLDVARDETGGRVFTLALLCVINWPQPI